MSVELEMDMTDDTPRALLTEREREIITKDADVSEEYYYVVASRVRKRIEKIGDDIEALDHHHSLGDELRSEVCE